MPYKHNGITLPDIRQGVTLDGVFYPWPISPERLAELGVVWEADAPPVFAPRPHAEIVAAIFEDVKRHRDALTQTGGYPVDHAGQTWWFHSDAYSLTQQLGLITAAMQVQAAGGDLNAPLIPVDWKTLSGARVPMTAALALKLLPASMAQQGAIFATADAKQVALEAAAEPATVDWRAGWPAVFEVPQP